MKVRIFIFIFFALLIASLLKAPGLLSNTPADLYRQATKVLGSRENMLLVSGQSRVVLWKSHGPGEILVMGISELRKYPENVFFSFPAYSVSTKRVSSNRTYQCSWRRDSRTIVYECGLTMRLPSGSREAVTAEIIRDLNAVLKRGRTPRDPQLAEVVVFTKSYS